jgi:GR25 family glycosyltransferase involved in LPS biosynthesis
MKKYFINLDCSGDRRSHFDESWTRWRARGRNDISSEIDKKMSSYWNIERNNHLGKCGCFLSHIELLNHIVENKLDEVLICEDDAEQISEIPILNDNFVYLGGFFMSKKRTDGNYKQEVISEEGINTLKDKPFDIFMTMSYYIGKWEVAKELRDWILSQKRYKAIDVMYANSPIDKYYYYPAIFKERNIQSTIRKQKRKSPNKYYKFD